MGESSAFLLVRKVFLSKRMPVWYNQKMESKSGRKRKEEIGRRLLREELEKQGWKSTGDIPYLLAHRYRDTLNAATLSGNILSFLEMTLAKESNEYREENIKKLTTNRTLVSPELVVKIEAQVKKAYGIE